MRFLLHKFTAESSGGGWSPQSNLDGLELHRCLVRRVIKESLKKLKEKPIDSKKSIRWELGSSWVQHLQKQETQPGNDSKGPDHDNEALHAVKGLGKQFKFLKKREIKENESEPDNMHVETDLGELSNGEVNKTAELEKLISEDAFFRLKETGTGLHLKVSLTPLSMCHIIHLLIQFVIRFFFFSSLLLILTRII